MRGYFTTTVNIHFNKSAAMGGWKKYRSEATLIGTLTYASGYKTIFPVTSTKRGKGLHHNKCKVGDTYTH